VRTTLVELCRRRLVVDMAEPPRRRQLELTDAGAAEAERIATALAARLRFENEHDESDFAPDLDD
jgi:hypothetical protein